MLKHLSLLRLRVNWLKSKLVPTQRISFLGMELDSVYQTARLTQERAQSVMNCLMTLSGRTSVPLKHFQRLLGHIVQLQLRRQYPSSAPYETTSALAPCPNHLQHKDVLVRMDNRATIAYINRQGSLRSRRMSQLTRHLSEASEVPSSHPHPRSVQSGSQRAVSSSTSRGVETPSPGSSADLGTVQSCSGGPVCISRNHPLP